MRQGQNRRMRTRNRKAPNPLTKTYESNGPDVKVRGTAQHIAEKYTQLSRDAHVAGDRVAAENHLQHAEHYLRIILTAQAQYQQNFGFPRSFEGEQEDDGAEDGDIAYNYGVQEYNAPQPEQRVQRQSEPRFSPFEEGGQSATFHPRERPERSNRGPDRPPHERPDRRERFRRRREDNINGFGQTTDDPTSVRQPSLPAFLTTPVRTTFDIEDQPAIVRSRATDAEPARQIEPVEPSPTENTKVSASRTRRIRTSVATESPATEGDSAASDAPASIRKPRTTRTRKKVVEDDLPVAD